MSNVLTIFRAIVEVLKLFIVFYCAFGFETRKKISTLCLMVISFTIILGLCVINPDNTTIYIFLWYILFILAAFDGNTGIKLIVGFFAIVIISLIDTVIRIVLSATGIFQFNGRYSYADGFSLVFIAIAGFLLFSKRKKINNYITECGRLEKLTTIFVTIVLAFWTPVIEIAYIDGITEKTIDYILFFSIVADAIFIAIFIVMMLMKNSNTVLEEKSRYESRIIDLQKQYIDSVIREDEQIREFKHDYRNHLFVMNHLCEVDNIDGLKKYLNGIIEEYNPNSSIKSGNVYADIFINRATTKLSRYDNFEFKINGHFNSNIEIEPVDFCIIISNIIDNAVEALIKSKQERMLEIEILNHANILNLRVSNSADEDSALLLTNKDRREHGYGIGKIKEIAEKYHGSAKWEYSQNKMNVMVEIFL